ncbi:Retrotransposable element [Phytophthora megakarya]|uniref:Retrotransposable element n=1 Tax=Phytophthora megakarya TaxID=4795 RepID=A0A225UIS9_9STRA|nr:Retrotransposable element [Phytophthora megakarya]
MARWLSFFADYNFRVEYKPGRLNVVADALSRRRDYAVKTADINRIDVVRTYTPSSSLMDEVTAAYAHDADAKQLIEFLSAPSDKARRKLALVYEQVHTGIVAVDDNAERIVVPNDPDLRSRIVYEYHYITMSPRRDIQDVRRRTPFSRETSTGTTSTSGRAMKPAPHSQAPLQPLPTPSEGWEFNCDGLRIWSSARFQAEDSLWTASARWCITLLSQRR